MDTYGSGFAVLWVAIWEMIGLMWVYGVQNVANDFKLMLGSPPSNNPNIIFIGKIILMTYSIKSTPDVHSVDFGGIEGHKSSVL